MLARGNLVPLPPSRSCSHQTPTQAASEIMPVCSVGSSYVPCSTRVEEANTRYGRGYNVTQKSCRDEKAEIKPTAHNCRPSVQGESNRCSHLIGNGIRKRRVGSGLQSVRSHPILCKLQYLRKAQGSEGQPSSFGYLAYDVCAREGDAARVQMLKVASERFRLQPTTKRTPH